MCKVITHEDFRAEFERETLNHPSPPPSPPFCDFQAQCYRFCFFRCQVAVVGVVRHVCVCMHAETGAGR